MRTVLLSTLLLVACGGEAELAAPAPPPEPPVAEAAPAPAAAAPAAPAAAFAAAPDGATVSFTKPADGATVSSPVEVGFALTGMEVKPAGELVEGTGHHHVIIDAAGVDAGTVVPADDTHVHFGKGQTEAELELAPGEHTLTLQLADGLHRSYGPALTSTITVTVEGPAPAEAAAPATTGGAGG